MKFFKVFLAALLAVIVGSIITGFVWFMIFMVMVASSMPSGSTVKSHSILTINFDESIQDTPETDPFAGFDLMSMELNSSISLWEVLRALEAAKTDDRIDGIYLRFTGGGSSDAATVEELRNALLDFRESGKFVVAYNETYTQTGYYLASAADKIYLQPEGGLSWQGLSFSVMFYKGLLDKLDISVEVFRPTVCKYKSAVEPFILTGMSDANRQQMTELAESMWKTMTEAVAESRGISVEQLNAIADNLSVTLPEEALEYGFVDGLIYEDEMDDIFAELGAQTDRKGEYRFVTLGEYAGQLTSSGSLKDPKVAIIYAEGDIVDGYGSNGSIYGNSLAELLKSARLDDNVKSVVLRVNSPGGSALASDVIWREMELLKAQKPVIVSMGGYAASGGYYISAPADYIVADNLTLTGSIGVFGMIPYGGKFLKDKIGITFDAVNTNTSSDMGGISRQLKDSERATIMRGVDKVYTTFTGLVSEGRNLPLDDVLEIAGGRVWSGSEGCEIGLVDEIGGLKRAISIAAQTAELGDNYRVEEILNEPSGFGEIFGSLNTRIGEKYMKSKYGEFYRDYEKAQEIVSRKGVQAYCPYVIGIN